MSYYLQELLRMKRIVFCLLTITLFTVNKKESIAQEVIKTSMLEEVNKLRRSGCNCGNNYMPPVPDLIWNDQLEKAAAKHAKDMSGNNLSGHTGSNGSSPDDRITGAGYQWWMCGENVAYGFNSVKDVVNGWKSSPGHCRNMMDGDFREMGAAREGSCWVQDFGRAQLKNIKYKTSR